MTNAEHQRARYAARRADGICVDGGCHEDAEPGSPRCKACKYKRNEAQKAVYRAMRQAVEEVQRWAQGDDAAL